MKVSIIIPVYNAEKYLAECIESAINQTYLDIEIIVVNDGSTDKSAQILDQYKDRIKIMHKENGGTASALNLGIKHMNGEWFKWLSADDVLYPNAVEILCCVANELGEESKNCIFYSNHIIIDSKGKKIDEFKEPDLSGLSTFERNVILLDHFIGNAISGMMHKSVFEKCGLFDEKLGFSEDYEFWLRACILFNYNLFSIPAITSMSRRHSSQLTHTKAVTAIGKLILIRNSILKQLDPIQRKKYQNAMNSWRKKTYPFRRRLRNKFREFLFSYLPFSVALGIITLNVKLRNSDYYRQNQ